MNKIKRFKICKVKVIRNMNAEGKGKIALKIPKEDHRK